MVETVDLIKSTKTEKLWSCSIHKQGTKLTNEEAAIENESL